MGSFGALDIPPPDNAFYLESTQESNRLDGGQALHGFSTYDILWERLIGFPAWKLRQKIDAAKAGSSWLYMTVDLNDDSAPSSQWADIRGKPYRDSKQADAGNIAGRSAASQKYHDNYKLFLNNVEVINNPSLYTDA
jgi:hypothetical protein